MLRVSTAAVLLCLISSATLATPATDIAAQVQPPLTAIYEARQFAPLWLDGGKPSARANQAIELMGHAAEDGLDVTDYSLPTLRQAADALQKQTGSDQQQAAFDVAMSRTLASFIEDLSIGRVAPESLGFAVDISARKAAFTQHLQPALTAADLPAAIAATRPAIPPYPALRQLLAEYRLLAEKHPHAPALSPLPGKKLEPGKPWAGSAALADWLQVLGDLPAGFTLSALYEGELVEGVKRFQTRHGLTPDGVIGKQTYDMLQVSLPERVQQIELAMERLRWIDDSVVQKRFILINIPQFTLWAYSPDAHAVLQMPVVVGQAGKNETPVMAKTLSTLVFSPYWNVPPSIARKEILPKLHRDPGYLIHENMELVDRSGNIQGNMVGDGEESMVLAGEYRIRQVPGAHNVLGKLKFVFPNDDSIYMHDTPSKKLFAKDRRDFSHGCVRVGNPMGLALFALETQGGEWDEAKVNDKIAASNDQHLALRERIPVLLLYFTANIAADGRPQFFRDIYGQDAVLQAALHKRRR